MHSLNIYLVGGAVRDRLLGLEGSDRDWVVVGSTPEAMVARGFVALGRDFPVFLHPHSHEEYALARTERKSGRGYRGFTVYAAPEVTLEQDLARRDLSINAMAAPRFWCGDAASVIDPLGGLQDLRDKRLRHASAAFGEDPLRILRVARFAAQFVDFAIAPQTMQLMREMVQAGEVADLVPERIWKEISRGLLQPRPSRMLQTLGQCGALTALLPQLDPLWSLSHPNSPPLTSDTGKHTLRALDRAAQRKASLPVRYACLLRSLGQAINTPLDDGPHQSRHAQRSAAWWSAQVSKRLRVPAPCRELADIVARERDTIEHSATLGADAIMRLLERCDALRRPERFAQVLLACECWRGDAAIAACAARSGKRGSAVGAAIRNARVNALRAAASAGHGPENLSTTARARRA